MKKLYFITIALILSSNILAQDKTKAKDFNTTDDSFLQDVKRIAKDQVLESDIQVKNIYSTDDEMDSGREKIQKRLEDSKNDLLFYQELPYWGLKDKINEIVIYRYLVASDKKKKIVELKNEGDVSIPVNYEKVIFDENGYPKSYIETSINRNLKKTNTKESKYIGPQLFDEIEINESGVYKLRYMGRRKIFHVYFKEKNGVKDSEINSFIDEKKQMVINNYLDNNNNNTVETKYYKNNLPTSIEQKNAGILNYQAKIKYNPDNTIKKITQIIVDTRPFTRIYKYTQKDSHNNWTERVCYNGDMVPMWIEKAEYKYLYDDTTTSPGIEENTSIDSQEVVEISTDTIQ